MVSSTEYAFYEVGIRCEQAVILFDASSALRSKRVTLGSLTRLRSAVDRLALRAGRWGQQMSALVDECVARLSEVATEDEYRLTSAYEHTLENLATLIDLIHEACQQLPDDRGQCGKWFMLGIEIVKGEGTTPWDVPPGREPSRERARWIAGNPKAIASLRSALRVSRNEVFPTVEDEHTTADWLSEMPTYLWGWDRIEAGLASIEVVAETLETAANEADADSPSDGETARISPEHRTIPMSYKRAAALLGKGNSRDAAEWLSKSVKDGSYACEHISRQVHIFDRRDFPQSVQDRIVPRSRN